MGDDKKPARKKLTDRYSQGTGTALGRVEEVTKSATKIVEKEEKVKNTKKAKKAAVLVEGVAGLLTKEVGEIKLQYSPFDNNTTLAMAKPVMHVLNIASTEFGLSQKELASIAVIRMLEELKSDSPMLKHYLK